MRRRLTDSELRMLAQQHIGLDTVGAASIFETELSASVDDVLRVVTPFLSENTSHTALRAAICALASGPDFPYSVRLRAILTEARNGLFH
jgi:hypothetical protein